MHLQVLSTRSQVLHAATATGATCLRNFSTAHEQIFFLFFCTLTLIPSSYLCLVHSLAISIFISFFPLSFLCFLPSSLSSLWGVLFTAFAICIAFCAFSFSWQLLPVAVCHLALHTFVRSFNCSDYNKVANTHKTDAKMR